MKLEGSFDLEPLLLLCVITFGEDFLSSSFFVSFCTILFSLITSFLSKKKTI